MEVPSVECVFDIVVDGDPFLLQKFVLTDLVPHDPDLGDGDIDLLQFLLCGHSAMAHGSTVQGVVRSRRLQ